MYEKVSLDLAITVAAALYQQYEQRRGRLLPVGDKGGPPWHEGEIEREAAAEAESEPVGG